MNNQALKSNTTEDVTKNRGFEILHHSYRLKTASGKNLSEKLSISEEEEDFPDWQYYIHNLVFRASGEFKEICLNEIKPWIETKVCIDPDKYDKYLEGLVHNFEKTDDISYDGQPLFVWNPINTSGIDRESLFVTGYKDNYSSFLSYNEKFDVFRFHEYLQYNPATTGLLKFIDELKEGKSYGITCDYNQFYSTLKSLEFFWD